MKPNQAEVFETAKNMFYKNGKRKEVIAYIHTQGIVGEAADQLATEAYKAIKGKIYQAIEVKEHQSHGGPFGKIAIGLFAIGIGVFLLFYLDHLYFLLFLFGFSYLIIGIVGLFSNPAEEVVG